MSRCSKKFLLLVGGCLGLLLASPAGAKLFTIDGNNNDINEIDGSDDITFTWTGSTGTGTGGSSLVSGTIRAVDLTGYTYAALQADVDTYVAFSAVPLDFSDMDVLIFDIVLDADSAILDEIGVAVGTDPVSANPDGGGWFNNCDLITDPGCRDVVSPAGIAPSASTVTTQGAVTLSPGNIFFPGATLFSYDKLGTTNNLEGGEITRRLFVAYDDTGPQSPLSKDNQIASFMLSSGTNKTFQVAIVPEPGTGLLLGVGMTLLAWGRRRS